MKVEMFGQALNDDELANELDQLVANQVADELGDLESVAILKRPVQQVVAEEPEERVKPKK